MGIVDFFILVIVCCFFAFAACWLLGRFAPGTPAFVPYLIWGVACLIIVVALAQALNLTGMNPQIPRVR